MEQNSVDSKKKLKARKTGRSAEVKGQHLTFKRMFRQTTASGGANPVFPSALRMSNVSITFFSSSHATMTRAQGLRKARETYQGPLRDVYIPSR